MVNRIQFVFLSIGHFCDHFFMLVFATVAALSLSQEWEMSYAELIPYATPGFVAFGVCAVPAGWLAQRSSRDFLSITRAGAPLSFGQGLCRLQPEWPMPGSCMRAEAQ